MPKQVQNLTLEDFYIQRYKEYKDPKKDSYSRVGIPFWVYDLEVTKLVFKDGIKEQINAYIANLEQNILNGLNIIVYSKSTGSGKSTFIFKLAMQAIDLGFSGACFEFSNLILLFKEIQNNSNTLLKLNSIRALQQKDFIIIDDFGSGHIVNKSFAISEMSDIIYYLESGESHKVPMFISSQIPLDKFTEYMTESAYSRILSNSVYIILKDEDIRL